MAIKRKREGFALGDRWLDADWPMYPTGYGWELALEMLGSFPEGTDFREIDDVDRCKLLIAGTLKPGQDPFDEQLFHVAAWHEDLVDLHDRELISGVTPMTEFEWDLRTQERLRDAFVELPDGTRFWPHATPPKPDDYEDEDWSQPFATIDESGIRVTKAGYRALLGLSPETISELHPAISRRVEPLITISTDPNNRYFDTAVREATFILEVRLKEVTGTQKFGQELVTAFWEMATRQKNLHPALRQELRAIFKFVRNEYAHNLRSISSKQCCALLHRTARVLSYVERLCPRANGDM